MAEERRELQAGAAAQLAEVRAQAAAAQTGAADRVRAELRAAHEAELCGAVATAEAAAAASDAVGRVMAVELSAAEASAAGGVAVASRLRREVELLRASHAQLEALPSTVEALFWTSPLDLSWNPPVGAAPRRRGAVRGPHCAAERGARSGARRVERGAAGGGRCGRERAQALPALRRPRAAASGRGRQRGGLLAQRAPSAPARRAD